MFIAWTWKMIARLQYYCPCILLLIFSILLYKFEFCCSVMLLGGLSPQFELGSHFLVLLKTPPFSKQFKFPCWEKPSVKLYYCVKRSKVASKACLCSLLWWTPNWVLPGPPRKNHMQMALAVHSDHLSPIHSEGSINLAFSGLCGQAPDLCCIATTMSLSFGPTKKDDNPC